MKNARAALTAGIDDDHRLVEIIAEVLGQARGVDAGTAIQLMDLIRPLAPRWPSVARAVADTDTTVQRRWAEAKAREDAAKARQVESDAAKQQSRDEEWVEGNFSSPSFEGHQARIETPLTKRQLYEALTAVAPHLSHDLKIMMVGQAWTEQAGSGIYNFNFGGVEGGSKAFTTDVWTTASISVATYNAQPEPKRAKYRDWTPGNPNGGIWGLPGHKETPRGTIQYQLDNHDDPIIVMTPNRRPAYETLNQAAAAFVHMVETRFKTLLQSRDPAHRKLAEDALDGKVEAYAELINMSDRGDVDDNGKALPGFGAWNGSRGYPARAVTSIKQTQLDLPNVAKAE